MASHSQKPPIGSFLLFALAAGSLCGAAILLALFFIGMPRLEAAVFALLSGGTLGAFFFREREISFLMQRESGAHAVELGRQEARIDALYQTSTAALACFDAGSLLVDRISPGLLKSLGYGADHDTRGISMAEILRVNPSTFQQSVTEVCEGGGGGRVFELTVKDAEGTELPAEITFHYLNHLGLIEMTLWLEPDRGGNTRDNKGVEQDLERFQRGMYRRENRILELKKEVNELSKLLDRSHPYKTDQSSEATASPFPGTGRSGRDERGGEN